MVKKITMSLESYFQDVPLKAGKGCPGSSDKINNRKKAYEKFIIKKSWSRDRNNEHFLKRTMFTLD